MAGCRIRNIRPVRQYNRKSVMNILISGDLYISDSFQNKSLIDQSVIDLFEKADYRMINLEAPLTANEPKNKIMKTGPHLRMSEDTVMPYIKHLRVDFVTMANNHILDFGKTGLVDTFDVLRDNNIDFVGAGKNLLEATRPLTIEKDGIRIAILNFCESEWSIADIDSPGANQMDIIDNASQIKSTKEAHDKVICIVHGGHEYYNLPSPRMQKQYRFYADQGADLIVGHHTHCISGFEVYKGVPIYYSLGNFLFTKTSSYEDWYTGLVLEVDVTKDGLSHGIHPVKQDREDFKLSVLEGDERDDMLERVLNYSNITKNESELRQYWDKYVDTKMGNYLSYWSPLTFVPNKYIRFMLKKIEGKLINKKGFTLYLNLMRCESHADLSIKVLDKYIKRNENSHS